MTIGEQEFIKYWTKMRKDWSWMKHGIRTFWRLAAPLTLLIDSMNYFIIGDTEYDYFSLAHFFVFSKNLILFSVFTILISGIWFWNYHENKYWHIKRKYNI